MKILHITTGDKDGIGLEIALKALSRLKPMKDIQFALWRSAKDNKAVLKHFPKSFQRFQLTAEPKAFVSSRKNTLWDMALPSGPARWVWLAGKRCFKNPKKEALVTGPLSKTQIKKEGFKAKGQTDMLKKISRKKNIHMGFFGEHFNVILLTDHIPLKKVKWTEKNLNECIKLAYLHAPPKGNKKIGVLGFNPHAGEEGLLGIEDLQIKAVLKKWGNKVEGPLIPDIAFLKKNRKKYSTYIALYHDQGLIPFKLLHERKSFQWNLGLPFIRTSVSHGTAKDIFGKNKAEEISLHLALNKAISLLKNQRNIK